MVTGFEGIATGRTTWLHGCDRITIEPDHLDKDGKILEGQWFDEKRVELVEVKPVPVSKDSPTAKPGGPQNDPPSRSSQP